MRRRWMLIAIATVAAAVIIYQNYDGVPGPLPNREQALLALNELLPDEAEEVLDMILVDKRHAFVPFVSEEGNYGMSFWVWERFGWKIGRVSTKGNPSVWKLDAWDPSKYFLVWNSPLDDFVSGITLYLIRERNGGMSYGRELYTPRVQLELPIDLVEKGYGAMPYPEEWVAITREDLRVAYARDSIWSTKRQNIDPLGIGPLYVGWLPEFDEEKRDVDRPHNSWGYSEVNLDIKQMTILNEHELER